MSKKEKIVLRCKRAKKINRFIFAVLCAFTMMTVHVFAESGTGNFVTVAVETIQMIVTGVGIALAAYGLINLFEGYSSENAGAKAQGIKQFAGGLGIIIVAQKLIPEIGAAFG